MAEFWRDVPRDLADNLEYRIALRRRAERDAGFRAAMMTACKHDVLFFFSAFCWLYEPRPVIRNGVALPNQIPMIPWDHQIPCIQEIDEHLGYKDIGIEKARGEGMSWIALLFAVRDWVFFDMAKVGMVSSTEDKADNPEDSDSLGWKIDWELTKLPTWMIGAKNVDWKRNIDGHTWTNLRNGSKITAYAATGDVARGGRARWFLMDELAAFPRGPDREAMASTQHVTNSRLVISTPKGTDGAYFDVMHEPSSIVKIVLDWKDNPSRNRGMYRLHEGKPVAVDPVNNPLPANYAPPTPEVLDLWSRLRNRGYKLDGKDRSPWYDNECDRPAATPQSIAQELDRDYGGSMHRVFTHEFFDAAEKTVRPPFKRGVLTYDQETLKPSFGTTDDGPLLLWTSLDTKGRPPKSEYVVGCDVATGLGGSYSSNSSLEVINLVTMEQVAEYAMSTISPSDLADLAIALCKWFWGAYLIWERNGPGGYFTQRVKTQQYPHIYYKKHIWKRGRKKTEEMGWWTDTKSKEAMMGEVDQAVKSGELKLHSRLLVREFGQYVRKNGRIEHITAANTDDDSSRGEAHGDRAIGFCVALQGARDRPIMSDELRQDKEHTPDNPPPGTMAYRMKQYEDAMRKDADAWDQTTNDDLAHPGLAGGGRWT